MAFDVVADLSGIVVAHDWRTAVDTVDTNMVVIKLLEFEVGVVLKSALEHKLTVLRELGCALVISRLDGSKVSASRLRVEFPVLGLLVVDLRPRDRVLNGGGLGQDSACNDRRESDEDCGELHFWSCS